jgi:hypothetical protein
MVVQASDLSAAVVAMPAQQRPGIAAEHAGRASAAQRTERVASQQPVRRNRGVLASLKILIIWVATSRLFRMPCCVDLMDAARQLHGHAVVIHKALAQLVGTQSCHLLSVQNVCPLPLTAQKTFKAKSIVAVRDKSCRHPHAVTPHAQRGSCQSAASSCAFALS